MKVLLSTIVLALASCGAVAGEPVSLFDGKSFDGWTIRKGEERWWRIEEGAIVGGSLKERIPYNTFITSKKRYTNFELTLEVRVEGSEKPNAGIQIRSERVPDHHEMIGYQADVGPGWWGKLYDESRRRKVVGDYVKPSVGSSRCFVMNSPSASITAASRAATSSSDSRTSIRSALSTTKLLVAPK